ncbi:MAG: TRAP transporter TatT component family protein [Desulfarculales bacterium]|jgi:tetratricopeptide (TPR) repeat protein|nr:TRAP transporter TatT component family protein [Desulfarculales bacterium]
MFVLNNTTRRTAPPGRLGVIIFYLLLLVGISGFLNAAAAAQDSSGSPAAFEDPALQLLGRPLSRGQAELTADRGALLLEQARQAYSQRDQREKIRECVDLVKEALALEPDNLERHLQFAAACAWFQGYHSRGSYDQQLLLEALASAAKVLENEPDNPMAHYLNGMLHAFMGRALSSLQSFSHFGFMEQDLQWVMERRPELDYAGAYRAMGRYRAQMPRLLGGNREEALRHYMEAQRLAPMYLLNQILLAELYIKMEEYDKAGPLLRQALDSSPPPNLEPEWRMWRERAGRVWERLQRSQTGEEEY